MKNSSYHNIKIFIFFSLGKGYDSPFSCVCLHGDRKPDERKSNLEKFKSKKVKFLICTDVAARGLDIKGMYWDIFLDIIILVNNYLFYKFYSSRKW